MAVSRHYPWSTDMMKETLLFFPLTSHREVSVTFPVPTMSSCDFVILIFISASPKIFKDPVLLNQSSTTDCEVFNDSDNPWQYFSSRHTVKFE